MNQGKFLSMRKRYKNFLISCGLKCSKEYILNEPLLSIDTNALGLSFSLSCIYENKYICANIQFRRRWGTWAGMYKQADGRKYYHRFLPSLRIKSPEDLYEKLTDMFDILETNQVMFFPDECKSAYGFYD